MIRTAVFGAQGRMGKLILAEAGKEVQVVQRVDAPGETAPVSGLQAVVDFSLASAWDHLDQFLSGTDAFLVSGTTGLQEHQMELLGKWSGERAVFYSSNMSVGIFVLNRLMKQADSMLGESFHRELLEFHHSRKIDSPSGTALKLLENWPEGTPHHSVRGGDITGEHHLHYMGQGERLVLSHMATDRRVFALGALRAVRFMAGVKKPGLYGMEDMLG